MCQRLQPLPKCNPLDFARFLFWREKWQRLKQIKLTVCVWGDRVYQKKALSYVVVVVVVTRYLVGAHGGVVAVVVDGVAQDILDENDRAFFLFSPPL